MLRFKIKKVIENVRSITSKLLKKIISHEINNFYSHKFFKKKLTILFLQDLLC